MSVKRMVFYQMFRFICGKDEVKGNEEKSSTSSIKIPQKTQTSQKMSNKYRPVKPAQLVKDKYNEKMPNIEKTKPNVEEFIRKYNEIEK